MEAETIAGLVVAAVFFGSIIWLEIHSRRQSARKDPAASSGKSEQPPESEAPTSDRTKKNR
jgi:hypothetical protein